MVWSIENTPFIWLLLASAAFSALLGVYAWRRSSVPAARPAAVLLFIATGLSLISAFGLASADVPSEIFWNKALILCTLPLPMMSLVFALQYAGRTYRLTRRNIVLLATVPFITLLLIATSDAQNLMWSRISFDDGYIRLWSGVWGWLYMVYSYLLILLHLAVLMELYFRSRGVLRWQVSTILLAWLVALGAQTLNITLFSPVEPLVLIGSASSFMSAVYAFAIFRFRMFNLAPIAHNAVMESLREGTLVLDTQDRLVEINPAAQRLFGVLASQVIGLGAAQVLHRWQSLIELLQDPTASQRQVRLGTDTAPQYYEVRLAPLTDFRGLRLGRLMIFLDITELKQAQERLLGQQRALSALTERERLGWELHDSLSQELGFINAQAQAVCELLATGRNEQAHASASRLAMVARGLHADVRELISDLSKVHIPKRVFLVALKEYLQQYRQDYGIHTELVVPKDVGDLSIEPAVAAQLLRIVQEVLTNARKHARAHNVRVSFAPDSTHLQIVIEDDGIGFDPAEFAGSCTQFGLRIMQERAAVIGGCLQIGAALGEGTRVSVQVPWRKEAIKDAPQCTISR